jgi:hypothetical protein
MRMPQAWRDARGKTLENELSDLVARINRMNTRAKSRCLDSIWATHAHLKAAYDSKSIAERKAFLQRLKLNAYQLWKRGDRPSAIGLGIVVLNLESRYVPDAANVLRQTEAIIVAAAR